MTAITLATRQLEPATTPTTRQGPSTDPDTFAAELATARSGADSGIGGTDAGPTPGIGDRPAGDSAASSEPAARVADAATGAVTDGRADPNPAVSVPTGDRRDRRHPDSGSATDAATGVTSSAAATLTPLDVPATATLSLALTPGDATGQPSPQASSTAAVAASETPGAASSPSPAAPGNPMSEPMTATATSSPAPTPGSAPPVTTATAPTRATADDHASPEPAAPSTSPAPSRRAAHPDAGPEPAAPASPIASAAASLAAAPGQTDGPPSKLPSGRSVDPGALAGAVTLSPTSSTSTAAAPTPLAPVASPAQPVLPLNAQLAPTLFHLRSAEAGTHVLTLTVAPEAVGPVTVRARVGADGIRIELSAPTAQGRSALDAILPELRRDLSQGGMNSTLSLAAPGSDGSESGRSPFDGSTASFAGDRAPDRNPTVPGAPVAREASTSLSGSVAALLRSGATALDVLA